MIDTRYNGDGSVFSQTTTSWLYDADNRLTQEQLTVQQGSGASVPTPYTDVFKYDLANNRTEEDIDGGQSISGGSTILYTYNTNGALQSETGTAYGGAQTLSHNYGYDKDGNLTSQDYGAYQFTYDLRGRMTSETIDYPSGAVTTDYTYDTDGTLASETQNADTASAATTYYLNDPNNPTGYTKAIQESSTAGGTPTRSYVLGLKVEAQSDSTNGVAYLITDGHGSTRALTSSTGAVISGQTYDYDAFGTALDFNANTAETTWLFGGDGFYDPASGWTYQLARWRDGFWFTQMDSYGGDSNDPISLHKYLYADADSVAYNDPSGHDGDLATLDFVEAEDEELDTLDLDSTYPAWVKATAVISSLTIIGGGLAWTQNGSPVTSFGAWALQQQMLAQQHAATIGVAYNNAVQTAVATGKYATQQVKSMPIFFVYQSVTPQIYQNDANAMAGRGTKGGASAPDVLNYLPGGRAINGPGVQSYANSIGLTPTANMQRDEYPYASTSEGGATPWLRLQLVPQSENSQQGGDLRNFYAANSPGFSVSFTFLVVLVP